MVWNHFYQLPAQSTILMNQNYKHEVVSEDKIHSQRLLSTPVFLPVFPVHKNTPFQLGLYLGAAQLRGIPNHPSYILPKPLLKRGPWNQPPPQLCPCGLCSWKGRGRGDGVAGKNKSSLYIS